MPNIPQTISPSVKRKKQVNPVNPTAPARRKRKGYVEYLIDFYFYSLLINFLKNDYLIDVAFLARYYWLAPIAFWE